MRAPLLPLHLGAWAACFYTKQVRASSASSVVICTYENPLFFGRGVGGGVCESEVAGEDITFHKESLGALPELTDPDTQVLCTFIESPIGEAEMSRFPALKLIATRSTGFDHVDLAAAKARGIAVANVPFYGENTVAEFAFALLLALSRRIIDADERVRAGTFSSIGLRGFDLAGKTIGIVGTGTSARM